MKRSRASKFGASCATLATVLLMVAGPIAADPLGQITTVATGGSTPGFSANSDPRDIATGADGNLWFLESGSGAQGVARITPAGAVTEFPVAGDNLALAEITQGPDGAMWFTGFNGPGEVFRVTTAGTVTTVAQGGTPTFPSGNVEGITTGPDGNIWVTRPSFNGSVDDQLVRITPGGTITGFGPGEGLPDDATLRQVTTGPDGNLYVTDSGQGGAGPDVASRVWRFDVSTSTFHLVATAGTTAGFTVGNVAGDITVGADDNLWFLFGGTTAGIARLTTAGVVTEFTTGVDPKADLQYVTLGCDGGLWINQSAESETGGAILRAGTDGAVTEYTTGLPADPNPAGITAGPDDNIWFTSSSEQATVNRIGTGCAAPTPPAPPAPVAPPAPTPVVVVPAFTG